ncbi:MAG TPA: STAS domain-containing protein, partial [Stellaceae bacterium]|nr:STAS domain-containing protein [Stellaceae bacterium]
MILRAEGAWLVSSAASLDRELNALQLPQGRDVTVDLEAVDRLDSAGAWLLLRTEHALVARGNTVKLANMQSRFIPLLEQVRARGVVEPLPHPIPPHHTLAGFVERIGQITLVLLGRLYEILGFTGLVTVTIGNVIRNPRRL